ncbi:MAG TPA: glycosyltransferase 87 family protein [Terriglobales bacterium]|nr:glycosyltransferase 87 family protein [Terriglobales bacterium]
MVRFEGMLSEPSSQRSQVLAGVDLNLRRAAYRSTLMSHSVQPSFFRVLLMAIVCYLVYLFTIACLANYRKLMWGFGDNSPYVRIASAIEHWSFADLHIKLFWGLPYTMAAVSSVTRLSNLTALLAISRVASLVTIALAFRLWGGWVTLAFVILSREWLERSLLGGAEPLFLALLFAGFLAARKERWNVAALLASLATVVRPTGVFGLAGSGLALLLRREYRKFALASTIGLGIGLLYILPLKLYFGDPMANVKGYGHADWNSNSL